MKIPSGVELSTPMGEPFALTQTGNSAQDRQEVNECAATYGSNKYASQRLGNHHYEKDRIDGNLVMASYRSAPCYLLLTSKFCCVLSCSRGTIMRNVRHENRISTYTVQCYSAYTQVWQENAFRNLTVVRRTRGSGTEEQRISSYMARNRFRVGF